MKKNLIIISLLVILSLACNKYNFNEVVVLPWDAEIALPLINGTFTVSDIFEIEEDQVLEYINVDEGLLGISYSGTIFSYEASDIVEISDQFFNNTIPFPNPGLPISYTDTISSSVVYTMSFEGQNFEDVEAKFLKMLAGNMNLSVASDIAYPSQIQIQIPRMKKNGIPYVFQSPLAAGESVGEAEPLLGYVLDLSQEGLGYNQLRINYQLIIEYDPNTPSTGEEVAMEIHFEEPQLDYVVGYFGENIIADQQDTIKIALFNNTIQGHFQFLDPYMTLDFNNSFGFPTLIDITTFKSLNQESGEITPIVLEGVTDAPFEISYPLQIGDSTLNDYYFDNSNSNIEVILNDADKYVIWGLNAFSNPNGPGSNFNFLTHTSKMEVKTKITVPLKGYAWDWVFSDTTLLENGIEIEDPEEISDLTLRLILNNGFPAEGNFQIYCLDSTNQVTDSLFESSTMLLQSAVLVNGIVSEPTKTIRDVPLSEPKRAHFIEARKLVSYATMQTTNGSEEEVIQIYEDYSIDILMGVKATLSIEL